MSGSPSWFPENENTSNETEGASECFSLLHIPASYAREVGNRLVNEHFSNDNISLAVDNLNGSNESFAYIFPKVNLNAGDARSERLHFYNSGALLLIMLLLFLTVITIWVFKVRRFRVLHETGLSMIYGIIVGVVLRYAIQAQEQQQFYLASGSTCDDPNRTDLEFVTGENIQLISSTGNRSTEQMFLCQVTGKLFRNNTSNYIQQALLFDPEIFFFGLLPPIIFYAGYSLQKKQEGYCSTTFQSEDLQLVTAEERNVILHVSATRKSTNVLQNRHFFRNLGSLLLYAFAGTTISCAIVGGLMYGYTQSGAEAKGTSFANLTGYPIPPGFSRTIIPSLLFGSLISATDPVTVLAIFRDLKVDHDLYTLVFGESVMNDAVAIVLFRSVKEYNTAEEEASHFEVLGLFRSIGSFIGIFLGSFLLGCTMALLTALLMKFSKLREYPLLETSMFVIMSYSTYLLAEFASLSGIVAVLFCGIMQSYYTKLNLSNESRMRVKDLFELLNFLAENFVFSYMGLSLFTYSNHQWVPGFILFSFVAIFVGRVINMYLLSFLLNLGRAKKISFRFQHMLVFAGLRGAIAFALAIRNTQSEERQLIFTTTLCIVMVTVLFCGGFTTLALQCLRIRVGVEDDPPGGDPGKLIPYDPRKGNWFVSMWTRFNRLYLLPILTHSGRPMETFCPQSFPRWCLSICDKCKPKLELLVEVEELEPEFSEEEEKEKEKEDKVISFRDTQGEEEKAEEGDLGLGGDSQATSYVALGTSQDTVESTL